MVVRPRHPTIRTCRTRDDIHKERHFFDRFGARAVRTRRHRPVPRVVPPAGRHRHRRVDPGLLPLSVGTGTRAAGSPRHPPPPPAARPGRALPLGTRPPTADGSRRPTRCPTPTPSSAGSTTSASTLAATCSAGTACSSCSTSGAPSTRPPNSAGPSASSASPTRGERPRPPPGGTRSRVKARRPTRRRASPGGAVRGRRRRRRRTVPADRPGALAQLRLPGGSRIGGPVELADRPAVARVLAHATPAPSHSPCRMADRSAPMRASCRWRAE